ncbi:uncharacterized protein LOC117321141 [Pecten maximus]|uniref:uncharacterized protein LOC117321141 n=1 Tax=Pecten maximus TaxID=6579 RepID=UPI0014580639|nr:uncharacterized protein LOC117321141 [Pecten maximus]
MEWEQYSASLIQDAPNEPVRATAVITRFPCYVIAVSCTSWPQILPEVLRGRRESFELTHQMFSIMPSSHNNVCMTFSKDELQQKTVTLELVIESVGSLQTLHLMSSQDMNHPLKVSCEDKRSRDQLSSESFMELQILTKDGDLDWRLENSEPHLNRHWITFYVNNISKGVQKSIAVMLSNYRISFSEPENRHLEREKDILIAIYRGRINTKPLASNRRGSWNTIT